MIRGLRFWVEVFRRRVIGTLIVGFKVSGLGFMRPLTQKPHLALLQMNILGPEMEYTLNLKP